MALASVLAYFKQLDLLIRRTGGGWKRQINEEEEPPAFPWVR